MSTKLERNDVNISDNKTIQQNNNLLKDLKLSSYTTIDTYNSNISMRDQLKEIKEENQKLVIPSSQKNFFCENYDFLEEMDKAMEEVILDDKIDNLNDDENNKNNLSDMTRRSSKKIEFNGTFMRKTSDEIKEHHHNHHHKNQHHQCHHKNEHHHHHLKNEKHENN